MPNIDLNNDAAYVAACTAYETARDTHGPGSPEARAASKAKNDAANAALVSLAGQALPGYALR